MRKLWGLKFPLSAGGVDVTVFSFYALRNIAGAQTYQGINLVVFFPSMYLIVEHFLYKVYARVYNFQI